MRHIKRFGSPLTESVTDEQVSQKAEQLKKACGGRASSTQTSTTC